MFKKLVSFYQTLEKNRKVRIERENDKNGHNFIFQITRKNHKSDEDYKLALRKNLLYKLNKDVSSFNIDSHFAAGLEPSNLMLTSQLKNSMRPRYDILVDKKNKQLAVFISTGSFWDGHKLERHLYDFNQVVSHKVEEHKEPNSSNRLRVHVLNFIFTVDVDGHYTTHTFELIPPLTPPIAINDPLYKVRKKEIENLSNVFSMIENSNKEVPSTTLKLTNCLSCNANLVGVTIDFCPYCRAGIR